jgi:outer membrane receptor for ferrienterochelin and colicins
LILEANGAYRQDDDWLTLDGSFRRSDAISLRSDRPDTAIPEQRRHSLGVRAGKKLGRRVELVAKARWLRDHSEGLTSEDVPGLGRYLIDLPETTDRFAIQVIERLELGKGSSLQFSGARQWVENESTRDRQNSPVDETRFRNQRLTSFETTATLVDGPSRTWVIGTLRARSVDATPNVPNRHQSVDRSLPEVPKTTLQCSCVRAARWKLGRQLTVLPGV